MYKRQPFNGGVDVTLTFPPVGMTITVSPSKSAPDRRSATLLLIPIDVYKRQGQDGERPGCVVEINRVCGVHFWRSELVSNLYRRSCGFLGGEVGFCSLKAVPTCVVYDNLIVLGLSVNNLI